MGFPTDGRLLWFSTVGSIPSGWSRDSAFDNRMLQGGDSSYTGPADGGGWHGHVLVSHEHGGSSHTHSSSSGTGSAVLSVFARVSARPLFVLPGAAWTHSHTARTSPAASLSYGDDGAAGGGVVEVFPEYVSGVVIKPDDGSQEIPDGASCFTDESTVPTGFSLEVSVDGKFVRAPSAAVGGGATGGSSTHTHTQSGHTHEIADHSHGTHALGAGTKVEVFALVQDISIAVRSHHNGVLNSGAGRTSDSTAVTTGSESSEAGFVRLLGIKNDGGAASTPVGVVVPYVGAVSEIPENWALMDGSGDTSVDCRDVQVKGTNAAGEIGDSGGGDSHAHEAGHVHGPNGGHLHGLTVSGAAGSLSRDGGGTAVTKTAAHSHTWTVTSTTPPDSSNTDPGSTSVDKRGRYRTVVFIKKVSEEVARGAPLAWHGGRRRRRPRGHGLCRTDG